MHALPSEQLVPAMSSYSKASRRLCHASLVVVLDEPHVELLRQRGWVVSIRGSMPMRRKGLTSAMLT